MKVSREQVLSDLTDDISLRIHGFSTEEIFQMNEIQLIELYNQIFEPIDEFDSFVFEEAVSDEIPHSH